MTTKRKMKIVAHNPLTAVVDAEAADTPIESGVVRFWIKEHTCVEIR